MKNRFVNLGDDNKFFDQKHRGSRNSDECEQKQSDSTEGEENAGDGKE